MNTILPGDYHITVDGVVWLHCTVADGHHGRRPEHTGHIGRFLVPTTGVRDLQRWFTPVSIRYVDITRLADIRCTLHPEAPVIIAANRSDLIDAIQSRRHGLHQSWSRTP